MDLIQSVFVSPITFTNLYFKLRPFLLCVTLFFHFDFEVKVEKKRELICTADKGSSICRVYLMMVMSCLIITVMLL